MSVFPKEFDRYIEIFGGSGAVLLGKPESRFEVYNDIDGELVNCFRIINFLCKCMEAKCIIGVPLNDSVDQSVIDGVHAYFDKIIVKRISERNLLEKISVIPETSVHYDELRK